MPGAKRGLLERLRDGEHLVIAEGFLFEFERRSYIRGGEFIPEVILDNPDLVKVMYEEFVHAGSDVVLAFQYYTQRVQMQAVGREDAVEQINRIALRLAREVADKTGTLMAGNISNSTIWEDGSVEARENIRRMHQEQITWAVEEGADFILGETFSVFEEAMLCLQSIKEFGNGLPAVVNIQPGPGDLLPCGTPLLEAKQKLEAAGADVVGINCSLGCNTILPHIRRVRQALKCPVACIPAPYRTSHQYPTMTSLLDPVTGERCFPDDMDQMLCSRQELINFTREMQDINVQVVGLCCGNRAHYTRLMAETLGHTPPASRFSTDMSKHISQRNIEMGAKPKENWLKLAQPVEVGK